MLSPSDFNNAVPQFTNGNYASNPINPQYIAEPDAVSYNRGTEPLQTLPAQWWNWFLNKFTGRFNKVNVYVKNIFNELAQILSIFNITPDGTEATPTTSQLKTVFECCYPEYVKTTANLASASTTVNGHPLSSNVTVTRSDLGLGTSSTVNTGTAAGCIPTVGTALGTTNNNILVTDASGNLKPSGITVGTAAGCNASAFRASTWTPALVECANKGKNGSSYSAFGSNAFNSTAFTTCTGTVTQVKIACATTGKEGTITTSGTINLAANAFNQYAEISTTTYPGACCTGTLTASSGCAYDSARLGGTMASCYLKTTGCAADSAKLGGYTYAQVRSGLATITTATICGVSVETIGWTVNFRWSTAIMECNIVKAFQCCLGGAGYPNIYCTTSRYYAPKGTIAGNDIRYSCVISNGGMKFDFGGNSCEISATSTCTVCYGVVSFTKFKN